MIDDDWPGGLEESPPLRTVVGVYTSRTVIAHNNSPDIHFARSINPYRGCEHGCIYCFALPTHAYLGLSPGLDFETKLFAKPNAPALLEKELRKTGYTVAPIAFGANTDPYQPTEKARRITRGLIEVLDRANHPLTILTKSFLVLRDIDVLASMARRTLCSVALSITMLDCRLARVMEPRVPTSTRRLEAVQILSEAGIPVQVLVAPIIPAINDHEIEPILEAAVKAGATGVGHVLLRLPLEIKTLFTEWLENHFPDRASRVLSLVRQTRGGALYRSAWGERQRGTGPYADLIVQRVRKTKRRLGLDQKCVAIALIVGRSGRHPPRVISSPCCDRALTRAASVKEMPIQHLIFIASRSRPNQ
ncbi:MAG: PA0069 family radical SAM protein [Alphaproteobacteria bacterium]|nr:PA0069 family radical SAM protein [Alphaproteobacteria bacterium]